MSAKDEILLINQTISEIDKKLFELKSKLNQISKQIPREEEALDAINIKINLSKSTIKHMKSKGQDLVDINEFKHTKLTLENQLDIEAETRNNLAGLVTGKQVIESMIIEAEKYRDIKKAE